MKGRSAISARNDCRYWQCWHAAKKLALAGARQAIASYGGGDSCSTLFVADGGGAAIFSSRPERASVGDE
jgi:hypothetical protein